MGTMAAREPHALRLDRHDTEIHERPHSRLSNPLSHRLFDANANDDCTSLFFDDAPRSRGKEPARQKAHAPRRGSNPAGCVAKACPSSLGRRFRALPAGRLLAWVTHAFCRADS